MRIQLLACTVLSVVLSATLRAQTAREQFVTGKAAFDAGNLDVAVKAFEKAAELSDTTAEYHLWLGRALQAQFEHANLLRQPFIARRARTELERAIQLDPSGLTAREKLLSLYLEVPPGLGGSVPKARAHADTIATLNPLRGHFARASIADRERRPEGMESEYRAAITEYPDSAVARAQLIRFYLNRKRSEDAFATVEAWQARGAHDEARREYQRAIDINPKLAGARRLP